MVVDTDVLIDVQRSYRPALEWFASVSGLVVPGFVAMELIQNSRNAQEVRIARTLVAPFPVVWPSNTANDRSVEVYARLHLSHGLGLIDALIAATAVSRGESLATHNAKHYSAYPGLTIVRPYDK